MTSASTNRYRAEVQQPVVSMDQWNVWDSQEARWVCAERHSFHEARDIADRLNAKGAEETSESRPEAK